LSIEKLITKTWNLMRSRGIFCVAYSL